MKTRILILSGNKDLLEEAKNLFKGQEITSDVAELSKRKDCIVITDDASKLADISKDKEIVCYIAVLHDPNKPLQFDREGFFFNEARKTLPGEFYCDDFIVASDPSAALRQLKNGITLYKAFIDRFNEIERGDVTVQFNSWSFSGGRGEDYYIYDLFKDGNDAGYVHIGDSIEINTDAGYYSNVGWTSRTSEAITKAVDGLITIALRRDDPEIIKKFTGNDDKLYFPSDYGDIGRDDILSDTYVLSYRFDENGEWYYKEELEMMQKDMDKPTAESIKGGYLFEQLYSLFKQYEPDYMEYHELDEDRDAFLNKVYFNYGAVEDFFADHKEAGGAVFETYKQQAAPIFFDPGKWEITFHNMCSYYGDKMEYGDAFEGDMRIRIGSYLNHDIYINAELSINASDDYDKDGNPVPSISIDIEAFPEGEYIFDFEKMESFEAFREEIDDMWKHFPNICKANYDVLREYFEKNADKYIELFMKLTKQSQPELYEKYEKLTSEYIQAKDDINLDER